ncbi:MAG: glycosyltransferase family 1 protein [Pontiellaceae bacterium]|nr:glycosyltransferase family 1 protein [Pontiellaceae bacterium]
MKILHVANFSHLDARTFHYACDRKINTALIRNGHCVFDFSYRDIARAEGLFQHKKWGVPKMNRSLIERVDSFRPDLLLLAHSELISIETLKTIRKKHPSMAVAMWYVDGLCYPERIAFIKERLPLLDAFFATTAGESLAALKLPHLALAYMPNPVDSSIETGRNFEKDEFQTDFLFCGRDYKEPERQAFVSGLAEKLDFLLAEFRGCLGRPGAFGADYTDLLLGTKTGLNYSRRNDIQWMTSDRLVHLTGNGILTFCPKVPGMETLFRVDEIVYFDELDDLIDKVRHFHQHDDERKLIAEAGWKRAHEAFSADRIALFMLETIFKENYSQPYEWLDYL